MALAVRLKLSTLIKTSMLQHQIPLKLTRIGILHLVNRQKKQNKIQQDLLSRMGILTQGIFLGFALLQQMMLRCLYTTLLFRTSRRISRIVREGLVRLLIYLHDLSLKNYAGYLGHSSTWSFSQWTMNLIRDRLKQEQSPATVNFDSSAYMLDLSSSQATFPPDISGLPTLDHALYLTNTASFHLCHTFSLFDEIKFIKTLHEFYDSPMEIATKSQLWYVQFLLVIAFAKAFLRQGKIESGPPGSTFFVRAINLLPHSEFLFTQPLLAIETLCIISLYLQSVEMRCSAYSYVRSSSSVAFNYLPYADWTSATHCCSARYAPGDTSRVFWPRNFPNSA